MSISYCNADDFYNGVYELVVKGLTFEADFESLTITLTGGY
jgi:hypothetical protein